MAIQNVKDPVSVVQSADTTYIGDETDQTYVVSSAMVQEGGTITVIDDGGTNRVQFTDGVEIVKSIVVSDEMQLTLSNGAVINVRGADSFTFNLGGNIMTGVEGVDKTFAEFAQDVLNSPLPEEGGDPVVREGSAIINEGGSVVTSGEMSNDTPTEYLQVALTGDTVVGEEGVAEEFTYQIDSSTGDVVSLVGSDITLEGFTVGEDKLTFVDVDEGTVTTETFTSKIFVSPSPINNLTDIYFDKDAEGNSYQLIVVGVVDSTLTDLDMSIV